ncbi:MAG: undecaprenyl-diphosphate phosphatase [Phycisphaeraceae bacterium]|nr:undecaprenyl-diphosphate phosphatase [Phycisphaeraceae bacterium]
MKQRLSLLLLIVLAFSMLGGTDRSHQDRAQNMGLGEAALLGVVEGLSEYLPISSTGHLILTQRALSIPTETADQKNAADAFAICIQAGAILAVLGLYWRRSVQMARGLIGRDEAGRRLAINLLIAFVPAAVVGLSAGDWIKLHLFGLWPIVAAWAAGGILILVLEAKRQAPETEPAEEAGTGLEQMSARMAVLIGLLQCTAMWPGVSRSLITILAGLWVGLRLIAAVEFSFLLGVLTLGAATAYDTYQHGPLLLDLYGLGPLVVGTAAALVSAGAAVRWMVGYLQQHSLRLFGYYRIALAATVAALILLGVLSD